MFAKILFVCFVFASLVAVISSSCRQSYVTICDSFEDFKSYKDVENINALMIGSEYGNTKKESIDLKGLNTINYYRYYKLTNLMIVNAIGDLQRSHATRCTYQKMALKYFTLYGNNIPKIEENHFPNFPLKMFSLVNNKIESIGKRAFADHKIENIDISDNLMEVIVSNSLPLTNVTKVVTIKNNKLTHIEPRSFPTSLKSLNLDGNKLRYIEEEALENLVDLQELSLSRNKFATIPKIKFLKQLLVFDISFNEIVTIQKGTFKDMRKLKLLDLSNNNIQSPTVLEWLITPGKQPSLTISLALNRLRDLDLQGVSLEKQSLTLYGNPWDCTTWAALKTKLSGHESRCDLEFLTKGNVPYCINYSVTDAADLYNNTWERDIANLREAVRKNEQNSDCTLADIRNKDLYPIDYGCVL
ncbi:hypothetical protein Zmor_011424 [Zophobas morio]|uniref:Uncharacterized protein n=1 Tax=Zophobas morio TaxID=2755281 RepID=A0AA38MKD5_9CUCU|nr:hypothetical protein Zmor_011424 [Zophobas morio]